MAAPKEPTAEPAPSGVWIRKGYCCRCGECCQAPHFNEVTLKPCGYLRVGGDGKQNVCAIYGAMGSNLYGRVCSSWPREPDEIKDLPNCTYYFEWQPDAK